MARRDRHNVGWWTDVQAIDVIEAWTNPGPKPKIHEDAKRRLRKDWPRLADTLDRLAEAEAAGCPRCPARYPIRNVHDHGEVVGWTDPDVHEEPDDWWECQLRMGHTGNHQHADDCSTIEWGMVP